MRETAWPSGLVAGGRGTRGGFPDDPYLVVSIASNDRYRVEGRDIHVHLPCPLRDGHLAPPW
jgi:hypothetical protein